MLDARQLRYFIAVAEELSFARAADRLNVAQSAVSLQIKGLEEAFGARLLNRRKGPQCRSQRRAGCSCAKPWRHRADREFRICAQTLIRQQSG
jgi:hypothetical protein